MHGGVASAGPAGASRHKRGVIHFPDIERSGGSGGLRVAFQAKIRVRLDQHFGVDRSMRRVTNRASIPQGFVFENERARLLTMTRSALLVDPGHGQSATRRFLNLETMRVVALRAIHPVFKHGMMSRQLKLRVNLEVALQTRRGIFAGIHDEFSTATPRFHVFASGAMARFAAGAPGEMGVVEMNPGMNASGEDLRNRSMTIGAGFVPYKMSALDGRRFKNRRVDCRARSDYQGEKSRKQENGGTENPSPAVHKRPLSLKNEPGKGILLNGLAPKLHSLEITNSETA
jgi:hypothetical protein